MPKFSFSQNRLMVLLLVFLAGLALLTLAGSFLVVVWSRPNPAPPQPIIFATVTPSPVAPAGGLKIETPPPPPAHPPPTPFPGANELGKLLVLEYHRIAYPEDRYQRTPDNFRADLQRLYESGYYPVNFHDVIQGLPEVPGGKKPVVLSFDDSDISQFRVLDDNTIDADSAVGILLEMHNQYPTDWPAKATFFVLGNDAGDHRSIFGQPRWAKAKVQFLVETGMEVGSHTVNHVDLSVASAERIYWELAISKRVIEEMAPGYTVQSLSVPYGGFPYTMEFLRSGEWGDYQYSYSGNAAAWGGAGVSPFDEIFDPYRVSRLEVTGDALDHWLTHFEENPLAYYISDGDPTQVTAPQEMVAVE